MPGVAIDLSFMVIVCLTTEVVEYTVRSVFVNTTSEWHLFMLYIYLLDLN